MTSLLLKNGVCATLSPPALERADVRITGGVIADVGPGLLPQKVEIV
jgi:hypothetical protein